MGVANEVWGLRCSDFEILEISGVFHHGLAIRKRLVHADKTSRLDRNQSEEMDAVFVKIYTFDAIISTRDCAVPPARSQLPWLLTTIQLPCVL